MKKGTRYIYDPHMKCEATCPQLSQPQAKEQ